jgi:molybdenum cofactor cytidylyltransferase
MRAAIVLAAGRSRRFGRADKLFAPLGRIPLLLHAIRAAREAPAGRVLVATTQPARVRVMLRRDGLRGVRAVPVRTSGAPLSVSLRCAVKALRPIERDVFIFLGDMPHVAPALAGRLLRRSWRGYAAVRPMHGGVPGHPVLVRNLRARTMSDGDAGFRFDRGTVGWISGGVGAVGDVDRRSDLARVRRRALTAGRL